MSDYFESIIDLNWVVTTHRGRFITFSRKWQPFQPEILPLEDKKFCMHGEIDKLYVLYEYEQDRGPVENFMNSFLKMAAEWDWNIGEVRKLQVDKEYTKKETLLKTITDEAGSDEAPPTILYFGERNRRHEGQLEILKIRYKVRIVWVDRQSLYPEEEHKTEETLQYVLRKFNVAIGRIKINFDDSRRFRGKFFPQNMMIVGYSVAHPYDRRSPVPTEIRDSIPSVVAFSANIDDDFTKFSAVFDYQPAWQEKVSPAILEKRMKFILEKRRESLGFLPFDIAFIRDGLPNQAADSELLEEVFFMKRICEEFETGYDPTISVVRVSADSSLRYSKIHDDGKYCFHYETEDLIEELKFRDQITGEPIDIPEPMHMAFHLSRRAGLVFATYRDSGAVLPYVNQTWPRIFGEPPVPVSTVDWEKVSDELSFTNRNL